MVLKASLLMLLNLLLIKFQITRPLHWEELLMILNWLPNLDGLDGLENGSQIWLGADPIKISNVVYNILLKDGR